MYCYKCGKEIREDSRYCKYCGAYQLDEDIEEERTTIGEYHAGYLVVLTNTAGEEADFELQDIIAIVN